ncbi:DUF1634 domain-containing protein [Bombilactobacillus thymidiniphilus]|uniref:DUF1634 domain-containing protein n=1 Tax=Bombilactobacillus thymidiniphilus TaxID=2923363 RepID=A0ABY4PEY4_9LACO|nr:DUF1634 domain-containing protein [Bombilactobacillus thymidiniphilus]UQS84152.1 DUF1634 domain-containing protein [Bombilactobacillus thymidiniphilus]
MKKDEMRDIELLIGKILRIGVLVSVTVMILGIILMLIQGQGGYATKTYPTTFVAIFQGVVQLKPYAVMMLGAFLLILTPVLRVIVSIYAFLKEKDYLYVTITTIVLIILAIAMIGGYFAGH